MGNDQTANQPQAEPAKHTIPHWLAPGFWFSVIAAWWTLPFLAGALVMVGFHDFNSYLDFLTFYLAVAVVAALYVVLDLVSGIWRNYGYWVNFPCIVVLFAGTVFIKIYLDMTLYLCGITVEYFGSDPEGSFMMFWWIMAALYIVSGTLLGIRKSVSK